MTGSVIADGCPSVVFSRKDAGLPVWSEDFCKVVEHVEGERIDGTWIESGMLLRMVWLVCKAQVCADTRFGLGLSVRSIVSILGDE